ncbi:unnamed protein product [Pleuronectes platessa]|uniref:Uncharacterized protein n=1 Tax=Pleuronectes platessa TaxID=8262 RepID=A0A9N7TTQ5_PLEPL|nr:unnamed protein product [Pleuronectes platessa]
MLSSLSSFVSRPLCAGPSAAQRPLFLSWLPGGPQSRCVGPGSLSSWNPSLLLVSLSLNGGEEVAWLGSYLIKVLPGASGLGPLLRALTVVEPSRSILTFSGVSLYRRDQADLLVLSLLSRQRRESSRSVGSIWRRHKLRNVLISDCNNQNRQQPEESDTDSSRERVFSFYQRSLRSVLSLTDQ